jgi:chromosome transmission fidelity protein 1
MIQNYSTFIVLITSIDLISTLLSLSTTQLPLKTLTTSLNQLSIYLNKFRNHLSTEHSLHLKRLVGLLEALSRYADEWKASRSAPTSVDNERSRQGLGTSSNTEVMKSGELMTRLGRKVEGINLLQIESYLRNSKVCFYHTYQIAILYHLTR